MEVDNDANIIACESIIFCFKSTSMEQEKDTQNERIYTKMANH